MVPSALATTYSAALDDAWQARVRQPQANHAIALSGGQPESSEGQRQRGGEGHAAEGVSNRPLTAHSDEPSAAPSGSLYESTRCQRSVPLESILATSDCQTAAPRG
eukprot:5306923-Prymnesium_polylepis.1